MSKYRLILGIAVGFVLALLWWWIFEEIGDAIANPVVVRVEEIILSLVAGEREPERTRVMLAITSLASLPAVVIVSAVFLAVLVLRRRPVHALAYFITASGALLLIYLLKYLYARPRPAIGGLVLERSLSFPSGHVIIAVGIYGFIAYIIARSVRQWWLKILVWLVYVALFSAIAVSRVYLGVHYVTDVVAGMFAGLAWLITGIFVLFYLEYRYGRVSR